jgi:hypothetical protein
LLIELKLLELTKALAERLVTATPGTNLLSYPFILQEHDLQALMQRSDRASPAAHNATQST